MAKQIMHPSDKITLANYEWIIVAFNAKTPDDANSIYEIQEHAKAAMRTMFECLSDRTGAKIGTAHGALLMLTQAIRKHCPPCADTDFAVETLAVVNPPWPGQTDGQFQFNLRSIRIALFFATQAIIL